MTLLIDRWYNTIVFLLIMTLLSACSGLAGEVEIVRTLELPPTALPVVAATFDNVASMEQGAQIYAQNCVRCHGISGVGDGEFVQNGQIQNIPDFTDSQTIQDESLQSWFDTITNGRIENLMPPWAGSLTEEERWAVALYTYTMSYDEAIVAQGQQVYDANCATCHAPDGAGQEDAPSLLGLVSYNEADLATTHTTHVSALELDIDSADIEAVTQYTRLLSSESRELIDPTTIVVSAPQVATTEEANVPLNDAQSPQATVAIPQTTGVIRGRILQGTEGGGAVEGLNAVVHIYDSQLREQIAEYTVGEDGTYQYDEVIIRPDYAYRMTTNYNGVNYSSPIQVGDPNVSDMQMDVTVYETGATPDDIHITSRATQANLSNQGLYIIEVIDLINTSDRAFILEDIAGLSEPASVSFTIPEGAQLQLEHTDPNRILLSADGLRVYDATPILPNSEHYVQFSYLLPIDNAQGISQTIDYTIAGTIAYFVETSHLQFEGDDFQRVDTRIFNNREYGVYEAHIIAVGDTLDYSIILDDNPLASRSTDTQAIPRETIALVFVLIGILFVILAGVLIYRGRQNATPSNMPQNTDAEVILQQIAQLDDAFDAGDIDKSTYQQQRNQLKAQLRDIMKTTK